MFWSSAAQKSWTCCSHHSKPCASDNHTPYPGAWSSTASSAGSALATGRQQRRVAYQSARCGARNCQAGLLTIHAYRDQPGSSGGPSETENLRNCRLRRGPPANGTTGATGAPKTTGARTPALACPAVSSLRQRLAGAAWRGGPESSAGPRTKQDGRATSDSCALVQARAPSQGAARRVPAAYGGRDGHQVPAGPGYC